MIIGCTLENGTLSNMVQLKLHKAKVRSVWTSDAGTMAQQTALQRWPQIVRAMVRDVQETLDAIQQESPSQTEGFDIIAALLKIEEEIAQDQTLSPIRGNGDAAIGSFNKRLASLGSCSWQNSPWLYTECYLYRRVQSIFASSTHWKNYDVFKKQKDSALAKSEGPVQELAAQYMQFPTGAEKLIKDFDETPDKLLFQEMTELALWGNATDLSLLQNASLEDVQKLQERHAIKENQRNIVDNDIDDVWEYLGSFARDICQRKVDIVLDNAGFELYTDLLYAGYLLEASLASKIVLHVKDIPWFVSDVTPPDVGSLLEYLHETAVTRDSGTLHALVSRFRTYLDTGAISVASHPFWTSATSFDEMPLEAPDLFRDLTESFLTIWKGDLNYRKLTKDGLWPYTTPFKVALGSLGSGSGLHILALRTNKSDTCVGVESEVQVQRLDYEAPDGAWVRNGKYAVVSFSDGK